MSIAHYAHQLVTTATGPIGFGGLLREWRRRRSVSQLELSLDCDISARHLSFVETGRSKPSRSTVLRLADVLNVPLRERNVMLLAAGFAPMYPEHDLDAPEMEAVRSALDRFLRAHEPYPALVTDRYHGILASNDALITLVDGCAPDLLGPGANALRIALHPDGMAPRTINFGEWSSRLLDRVRREAALTGDPDLYALHAELSQYPGVNEPVPVETVAQDIVVPLRLRDGEQELAFVSTISTFGTAIDITLAELSIEALYPANAQTAMRLMRAVGQ